jgi:hypothetical protein
MVALSTRRRRTQIRSWLAAFAAAVLLAALASGPATAATATTMDPGDPAVINDWNELAATTLVADTTKAPPDHILYMAFVQAAVYDAVVGIKGRYQPYQFHARAPRRASAQAAAVAAAHQVLVTYVPSAHTTLDAAYASSLAQLPDGKAKARGVAFGTRVADNLIRLRAMTAATPPSSS